VNARFNLTKVIKLHMTLVKKNFSVHKTFKKLTTVTIFFLLFLAMWPGFYKTDNIKSLNLAHADAKYFLANC